MIIDITKQYKTRDGKEIRIYATDCGGRYKVHGAYKSKDAWNMGSWTSNGIHFVGEEGELDLTEVPQLQDMDIVVAWDDGECLEVTGIYDAVNNCLNYDFDRNGAEYDHYELCANPSQHMLDMQAKLKAKQ